jgi:NAD(P)-dependent dehydrogenase (short-subunit alcohol dehydrogenase family)
MQELTGKVAFITGGASGIGLGTAKECLAAGMRVVIADVHRDSLEAARAELAVDGASLHAIRLDVADREAMARAADETVSVFGKVHLLFNNAGVGLLGPIKDASYDDWDWMLAVNLHGVFNGVRSFLPHLRRHGEGAHIVSTASMGGLMVTSQGGVYSTAKFGVVAMMQCLREDLAAEDIGVSVLCPAAVNTNIFEHDRLRPAEFADSGFDLPPQAKAAALTGLKAMLARGMDPRQVGRIVLDGVRRNAFYLFTHNIAQVIRQRRDALLASLPDEPINAARLEVDMRMRDMMKRNLQRSP